MSQHPKARRTARFFLVVLGIAVFAGHFALNTVAGQGSSESSPEGLPVDATVFAVSGEESDPLTVEFSNGAKTVTYIPMIHIGTPEFYKAVAAKVTEEKKNGAVLYYEFIDFDVLDDPSKRKARALVGILPTPHQYDELSGDGYIGQPNDDFLGLINDKDLNVDLTAEELIEAYETRFGPIEVTGPDASSDLSEMATVIMPGENVNKVVLEERNKKIGDAISNGPDSHIVLLFGGAHGPGIFAELQTRDSAWRRVK